MRATNLRLIFLFSIMIALIMAISNSYLVNLKGGEIDAERFLDEARIWAETGEIAFSIDATLFILFLGIIKRYLYFDEFSLTCIGIILYYITISCYMKKLRIKTQQKYLAYIIIYFIFLSPSLLFRLSALLREPYIISALGFSLIYANLYIQEKRTSYYFISCFVFLVGSMFHKAFIAFSPIYCILLLCFGIKFNTKSIMMLVFLVTPALLGLAWLAFNSSLLELRGGQALQVILTGNVETAENTVAYKSGRDFRTTYDYGADFSSIFQIIMTIFSANLYYYFAPFPQGLTTATDLFASVENMLRILIIIKLLSLAVKIKRREMWFGLFVYFTLNCIWAIGTSNYGTGTRHHMTTSIILLYCCTIYYQFHKEKPIMMKGP